MAVRVREPRVGQRVYRNYSPQKAGIIRAVLGPMPIQRPDGSMIYSSSFAQVRVEWVGGETTDISTSTIADFDALIADHRKKLQSHELMLVRLEQLAKERR